jgi:methyl-accepting chemotaxis protein
VSRPPLWRRQFYVHPIQRKYLALSLIPLLICSVAIILFAFLPLQFLVRNSPGDFDAVVASSCLGVVGRRLWPAIFLSMFLVAGLSVLATHAVAGPLIRLEQIGRQLAAGEIPGRVRIREGDDLQEIAADLNVMVGSLRGAIVEIRDQTAQARTALQTLRTDSAPASVERRAQELETHLAGIEAALKPFRL